MLGVSVKCKLKNLLIYLTYQTYIRKFSTNQIKIRSYCLTLYLTFSFFDAELKGFLCY